jgi:ATP-binding cassette, subfamily B, multidrug efflux pump
MMGGGGPRGMLGSYHDATGKAYDPKIMGRLIDYLRPHKWSVIAAMIVVFIASGANLAAPYLLKLAIDQYIVQNDLVGLGYVAIATAAVYVVAFFATWQQTWLTSQVGQKILATMRGQVFGHLQALSPSYFDRHESGVIMSRLVNDVAVINDLLSSGIISVLADMVMLFGIVGILLWMDVRLALLTFAVMPLMVLATALFTSKAKVAYRETRSAIGAVAADLQENISAVRVVQSFAREDVSRQKFDVVNQRNRIANIRAMTLASAFMPAVELLSMTATAIVVLVGGLSVMQGAVTLGVVVAFLNYVQRFFAPIRDLSQVYTTFQAAMAGGERVLELLDTAPDIQDRPGAIDLPTIEGHIVFDHVDFGYTEGELVLRDISLEALPGQTIALVGPTGAGKTSIVSLLTRFYDVTGGRITIDGHDLRDVSQRSLRSQFGIVLQDPFLFSGTIADNIRFGRPDAKQAEIEDAARVVGVHDFVASLPKGYDTAVMERGQNFSQGQRQLLSFARAVLARPRILILDEATSSIDSRTERLIQRALMLLLRGRTSFVIAHRLSTIENADLVLVVDGGRIVQRGTHRELLGQEGLYAHLHQIQHGDVALAEVAAEA